MSDTLAPIDRERLEAYERIIERGLAVFREVGVALAARDRRTQPSIAYTPEEAAEFFAGHPMPSARRQATARSSTRGSAGTSA